MAKSHDSSKMNPQHQPKHGHEEAQPVRDVAAAVATQTGEILSSARDMGKETLESAKESVATLPERATEAISCQMKHAAEQLRERLPQEGTLGSAGHKVADGLECGATYLKEHDFKAMGDDLAGVVRSHPIPLVLAGIGLGFLLGRTIRS